MTTRTSAVALTALLAVLAVSGCSSDSTDDSSGTSTTAASGATSHSDHSASSTPSETPSDDASEDASSSAPAEEVVITIKDFKYSGPDSVSPGAEVVVKNEDAEAHTVTADDGEFAVDIAPGETATFTAPDEAGDYDYFCEFHGNMTSTLTVA